jgi:hypothetical protein
MPANATLSQPALTEPSSSRAAQYFTNGKLLYESSHHALLR